MLIPHISTRHRCNRLQFFALLSFGSSITFNFNLHLALDIFNKSNHSHKCNSGRRRSRLGAAPAMLQHTYSWLERLATQAVNNGHMQQTDRQPGSQISAQRSSHSTSTALNISLLHLPRRSALPRRRHPSAVAPFSNNDAIFYLLTWKLQIIGSSLDIQLIELIYSFIQIILLSFAICWKLW